MTIHATRSITLIPAHLMELVAPLAPIPPPRSPPPLPPQIIAITISYLALQSLASSSRASVFSSYLLWEYT